MKVVIAGKWQAFINGLEKQVTYLLQWHRSGAPKKRLAPRTQLTAALHFRVLCLYKHVLGISFSITARIFTQHTVAHHTWIVTRGCQVSSTFNKRSLHAPQITHADLQKKIYNRNPTIIFCKFTLYAGTILVQYFFQCFILRSKQIFKLKRSCFALLLRPLLTRPPN